MDQARDDIFETLKEILIKQLCLEGEDENIILGQNIRDDLNADSFAVIEIVLGFEEAFDVPIEDKEADQAKTVRGFVDLIKDKLDRGERRPVCGNIWQEVKAILIEELFFDEDKDVTSEQHLRNDLGADSLAILSIISAIDNQFKIEIRKEEIPGIRTVNDILVLVQNTLDGNEPGDDYVI